MVGDLLLRPGEGGLLPVPVKDRVGEVEGLNVCRYVCMRACMYMYIYIYTSMYACMYIYICIYVHMTACMHVVVFTSLLTFVNHVYKAGACFFAPSSSHPRSMFQAMSTSRGRYSEYHFPILRSPGGNCEHENINDV